MQVWAVFISGMAVFALMGCAGPTGKITPLSEIKIAEGAPGFEVQPALEEGADSPGFFGRILSRNRSEEAVKADEPPVKNGETPVLADTASAKPEALLEPKRKGLFAGLRRAKPDVTPVLAVVPDVTVTAQTAPETTQVLTAEATTPVAVVPVTAAPVPKPAGLFRRVFAKNPSAAVAVVTPAALRQSDPISEPNFERPELADIRQISPGISLPYGALAKVCGMKKRALGREVAHYPDRRPTYRLYDTNPSSILIRTHYITGFKDGCVRQFTGALALFGDATTHETVRYGGGQKGIAFTRTDREYALIRKKICRARVGRTCPAKRAERLEQDLVFLTVYDRFGTAPKWADILIFNGRIVAKDFKKR